MKKQLEKLYRETNTFPEGQDRLTGEVEYDFTHRKLIAEISEDKVFIQTIEEETLDILEEPERQEQYLYLEMDEAIKWINEFLKSPGNFY